MYTRIIGELRKLGIKKISRQTVRNILKEEGIEPGPDRTSDSWENFIARHAKTLWAVDFFSVRTVTARGFQEMYVLIWICMTSREVIVSESTQHPNSAWVVKQTEAFLDQTLNRDEMPSIVMHDRDAKFSKEFVAKRKEHGARNNALPKASPNLKDHVACCTSLGRWGVSDGKRRRSESFSPWLLRGLCASGGSYRHSGLSV
jgi:putative transposase